MRDKTLVELRGIAQAFGVPLKFDMDKPHLIQAIELKQKDMLPKEKIEIPLPPYDPRLMKRQPARLCDQALLDELLKPYVERGLRVEYKDDTWRFSFAHKNDTGTLRQSARVILGCAAKVME